jgi:hypothetical protein
MLQFEQTCGYWGHSLHEERDAEKINVFLIDEYVDCALRSFKLFELEM